MLIQHLLPPVLLGLCPVCWLCIAVSVLALAVGLKLLTSHLKRRKEKCEKV